jgi:hypothetical protein
MLALAALVAAAHEGLLTQSQVDATARVKVVDRSGAERRSPSEVLPGAPCGRNDAQHGLRLRPSNQ